MFKFFKKLFSFFTVNPEIKQVVEIIGARRLAIKIARKKSPKKINEMVRYCNHLLSLDGGLEKFYFLTVQGILNEIEDDPLLRSDLQTILSLVKVQGQIDVGKFRNFIKGFKEGLLYGKA